jgi:hypothetical protein
MSESHSNGSFFPSQDKKNDGQWFLVRVQWLNCAVVASDLGLAVIQWVNFKSLSALSNSSPEGKF